MTAASAVRASVVGGSGYSGGELIRLLDDHPDIELVQVTSRTYHNKSVGHVHPNLRDLAIRFSDPTALDPVDVLFAATPHGVSMNRIEAYLDAAEVVVDLSADFRLTDEAAYDAWYDGHTAPQYLERSVYGLTELTRDTLPDTDLIACGGCNATVTILGLYPLAAAGILETAHPIVVDLKVGSSEGGAAASRASSHAERSGIVRPYAPTAHRHEAEIVRHLDTEVSLTTHAVDMTRGAVATCHVFPDDVPSLSNLWGIYREAYEAEPFVRLVAGGGDIYRYPEAKVVAGTNYCDVGFVVDDDRIVVFAAIDNLGKGAAGQAVQAANVALGLDETAGLHFPGLHPVGAP